ncbi:PRC and DUF2382 domain-containing protein [Brevibacterium sp. CS2]|uniref:PRC and DUF2382 domain-containing protein n=1 Tax=Brevibacterium sp. CS2 TaxID=2575923 RepID=UPI0010C7CE8E|nr:PRC and DUF2382 domain-containing protein [Brevibacterium sp. CS2]QCP05121.1 DUF2382 domain-containing protein [Brevibacterium sp. CS2]
MNDRFDLDDLTNANIYDQDSKKVGSIGQVYLDDQTDEAKFATVKTGLFGTNETFVPLNAATRTEDGFTVPFTKDFIKDAPNIDADGHLDPAEERRIFEYYSLSYDDDGRVSDDRVAGDGRDRTDAVNRAAAGTAAGAAGAAGTAGRDDDRRDADRRDADRVAGQGAEGKQVVAHEERLKVGTEQREAGKARLRKRVVSENQQVEVPVQREELVVERESIDPNSAEARTGSIDGRADGAEETITLREERPVVDKETVATEKVNVGKRTVTDSETVSGEVRKEQIDVDADTRGAAGDKRVDELGNAQGRDVDGRGDARH